MPVSTARFASGQAIFPRMHGLPPSAFRSLDPSRSLGLPPPAAFPQPPIPRCTDRCPIPRPPQNCRRVELLESCNVIRPAPLLPAGIDSTSSDEPRTSPSWRQYMIRRGLRAAVAPCQFRQRNSRRWSWFAGLAVVPLRTASAP